VEGAGRAEDHDDLELLQIMQQLEAWLRGRPGFIA